LKNKIPIMMIIQRKLKFNKIIILILILIILIILNMKMLIIINYNITFRISYSEH